MIDLYALTSPNVQKIFIMLEEIELPYRVHAIDVFKGDHYDPEFRKLNPNGRIPVIVDSDGPGGKPYTVFESGAILIYLADKTGKLMPTEKRAHFDMLQWLMIQLTGVGPMFGQYTHFKRFAGPGNDYAMTRYQTEVKRLYDVLDQRLGESKYLGGPDYTIADVATFPWTRNHAFHNVNLKELSNVGRWFEAISARPAVKRALTKVDAIQTVRDTAKPEDLDRLFGRGKFARV
ncbi:MAG TPA: glutathione S-transferase N-terminal domain-containing protein [Xanthobacteraceae bacterium]|nr:glutathione S-transferase N-terminal domain-containing protein [Xanthobacteraceae bacterium]